MSQQNINVGNYPNDQTADTLYVAFSKTQANFSDLYSNGGGGGSFGAQFLYWFAFLPTIEPGGPGLPWNNGGTLSVTAFTGPIGGTDNFNDQFLAWFSSLPTSLPPSAGLPWNNGGEVAVS